MQGSPKRRSLDSFAPFREEEIVEQVFKVDGEKNYTYYPTYAGRLRVARERFPLLSITTRVIEGKLRQSAVVHAKVSARTDQGHAEFHGAGVGTADAKGDGRLADSLIELAETRAITRALRTLGIGTEFNGAEEVLPRLRDDEVPSRKKDSDDRSHDERRREAADPDDPFAELTDRIEKAAPRRTLGDRIMKLVENDREKAGKVLNFIIGRDSVRNLSEFEVKKAMLALDVIHKCGDDGSAAKRWLKDVWRTVWFTEMDEAQYEEAVMQYKADVGHKTHTGPDEEEGTPF